MSWARAGAALATAALLAGCATRPPPVDALAGRMAVQVQAHAGQPARSLSASFDLRGSSSAGGLALSSPIGSLIAQANWDPSGAQLTTSQGSTRYANLDALTQAMLGEAIPVAALFDWLRGRPWPGAPSVPAALGFAQLGWQVDTSRFAESQVIAERSAPPVVTVRARLDAH